MQSNQCYKCQLGMSKNANEDMLADNADDSYQDADLGAS